jgi:hypothetical protein
VISFEETFGKFFGAEVGFEDCEVLAVQHIDHKILQAEARLYGYKWFDYRPMHPTVATYLMAHHYNRAYGNFMAVGFDMKKKFMSGFKKKDFFLSREKKSFWKLRQKIDELGIRYDFFCNEAMNWCLERGWRQPPRPAHISSNDEMIIDITNKWELECRARLQFALSPRYTIAEFIGAGDQIAYENWLASRIMQRQHAKYGLHAALYIHDAIRIETALRLFTPEEVTNAVEFSLNSSVTTEL